MRKRTTIRVIVAIIAVAAIAYATWQHWYTQKINTDTLSITKQLSDLMLLPEGEPNVATIVDAAKLKQKDVFYKRAENGDKVVIWKERAVIYRPSVHKIVDFGIVVQ